MIMLPRFLGSLLLLTALGGLGGCATAGNPNDPLEAYNRAMFGFNESVDNAFIKPVATGYKKVMPDIARTGVTNFFANLGDIWIGINNILQGKIGAGASDFGRFAINSTVGILGLIDVASNAGLEKHNEDFGQTLGRWGVGIGAYFVLPILGPSTIRDGISQLALDWRGDPVWYVDNIPTRNMLVAVHTIDTRANLLDTSRLVEDAALDRYTFMRDAYLQRRRSLIYDGEPPRESDSPERSEAAGSALSALPPARVTDQWGKQIAASSDELLTPAREFADAEAQPAAAQATAQESAREAAQADSRSDQPALAAAPQLTLALELPESQPQAAQAAAGVTPRSYAAKIPGNYTAELAPNAAVRAGIAKTSLVP